MSGDPAARLNNEDNFSLVLNSVPAPPPMAPSENFVSPTKDPVVLNEPASFSFGW
jgi:hypothetical protein